VLKIFEKLSTKQNKKWRFYLPPKPILFIDEIHRFSKSQQDSLLAAVEKDGLR
jgi:replication-associated recombination protein RarA